MTCVRSRRGLMAARAATDADERSWSHACLRFQILAAARIDSAQRGKAAVDMRPQRVAADVIVAAEGVQSSRRLGREVSRSDVINRHRNIQTFPDARRWTSTCSRRAGLRKTPFPISRARHDRDFLTTCASPHIFVLRYFLRSNHSTTGGNVNISVIGAINAYAISCPVAVPAINPRIAVTIVETGFNSTR